jgi:4-amino-4-deoxy-L-arabinose transferase-like glycosyltransferase
MKLILKNELTIAILAAILFIPFLGYVHLFDWDEINFAESAREMIATGNYFTVQINYERFTEKPPLFFWLQVLSMKTFGINDFAARFPNAVCGIVTLVVLFRIGKRIFNETFARIWVMIYLGTLVTFLYFKSGIIDPWFNLFIFLGIYYFQFLTTKENINRIKYACYAGIFLGLAVLTKGPVAILISLLSYIVFVVLNQFTFYIKFKEFIAVFLCSLTVCFAWFGIDLIQHGPGFITEFLQRQIAIFSTSDADHGEPFFYHWWVLLLGCFPASIFFMKGMFIKTANPLQRIFKLWMVILFWVTLLLFSIVKTKIVHYSSLCWFPLTALAAYYVYNTYKKNDFKLHTILQILLGIVGIALGILLAAIPFVLKHKDKWIDKVDDVFARANLQADVHWYWWDGIGGFVLLIGVLFYLNGKNIKLKTSVLLVSVTICCLLSSIILTSKIEAISQRANIEFFEARQNENCYVETWGYKSYAQYYYAKKTPYSAVKKQMIDSIIYGNTNRRDTITSFIREIRFKDWMLHGKIDNPVYFSLKIQNKHEFDAMPQMKKLYEKNGFVFYKRMP